jgi:hypothetical protein
LAKSSAITFENYCSAINKTRAEPGNEAGKINMAADISDVINFLYTFNVYNNLIEIFPFTL